MKKIFALIVVLLLCFNSVSATENLSFIYINGSNNNDKKMRDWYYKGVNKLHPVMRKKFLKNRAIKKYYNNIGKLNIKEEPVIFFWGYNSKQDLDYVKGQLELSKMVSSSGAYLVRSLITQYMHDAIWVQKPHNMLPILDNLNEKVKAETNAGNEVILYGYSAGTFVTYEYLFNKLRYLNTEQLFSKLCMDEDFMDFVKKNPQEDTCISALSEDYAGIGSLTSAGHIILNQDKEALKRNYLKLNEMTKKACAPKNKVRGVVNFASPLPLFYSDMSDESYALNYYNRLMIKYIFENGIFMITANFREDPLGFPTNQNLTIKEFEKILNISINNPTGVVYDNSGIWSKRMFPFAHTSYWTARGAFTNAVVKSFVNGYKFQYDEKYQKKILKRSNKKSEL